MTDDSPGSPGTAQSAGGRRIRLVTVTGMLLLHALALAVWSGTWVTASLDGAPLAVGGDTAAPALPALALCGLALAAALTIAGPFFRAVLAVLQFLLGVSIALSGVLVLADPVAAAAPAVTARTGIVGTAGVAELLDAAGPTALPILSIAVGAASAALGVLLLATSRRWPNRSRRFSATRVAADAAGPIEEWDALSDGTDPTADPGETPSRERRGGARGTGDGAPGGSHRLD